MAHTILDRSRILLLLLVTAPLTAHSTNTLERFLIPRATTPQCDAALQQASARQTCWMDGWGRVEGCQVEASCRKNDGDSHYNNLTLPLSDVARLHNCNGRLRVGGC
ncbi:TPA: hypothetical protein ACKP39_002849 [Stenotrophomonas maltophilia]